MSCDYTIKDLKRTGGCPQCGESKWFEHDGMTICYNCRFWVEGTLKTENNGEN